MVTIRKKSNIAEQSGTSPQREGESRGGTVVGRSTVGNVTITRMKRPTPTTAGSNPASERVETIPVPKWTQVQADWQSRFDQAREGRQAEQETVSAAGQGGQIGRFIGAAQRGGGFQNVVGTPQNTQAKLSALESEKSRLEAGLDLEGAAALQGEIDRLKRETGAFSLPKLLVGMPAQGAAGFAKSISGTAALLEGVVTKPMDWLFDADGELVKTGMFYRLNEGVRQNQEALREYFQPNVEKGGKAAQVADFLGTTTLQAIPQAIVAFAAGGGEKGLEVLSRAAQAAPGVFASIKTVAQSMPRNPASWSSFFQTIGNDYEEAKADGLEDGAAVLYALADGVLNAGIEVGGGLETMTPDQAGLKEWLKTAIEEGNEEVAQGIIQRGLQNLMYGKGNPLYSTTDESAVLNPRTALQEWSGGAFAGGVLSGVHGVARYINADRTVRNGITERQNAGLTPDEAIDRAYKTMQEQGMFSQEAGQGRESANEALRRAAAEMVQEDFAELQGKYITTQEDGVEKESANSVPVREATQDKETGDHIAQPLAPQEEERINSDFSQTERTIQAARAAFGENGAKGFELGLREGLDQTAYFRDYTRVYNAGLAGKGLDDVEAGTLTQAQRGAAYEAGRSDTNAAAKQAGFTTVWGKDSGLVLDEYVKSMDQEASKQVNQVAKMLGVKVQFAERVADGKANAQLENGIITIEKNNSHPVRTLFGHEITHRIQQLSPREYQAFRAAALSDQGFLDERVEALRGLYNRSGIALDNQGAMDELAADYAGRLMEDGQFLERFIERHREDRTLLEKLRDAFRDLADRVTGKYRSQAKQAELRLTRALEAAAKEAETLAGQQQDVRGTMKTAKYSLKEDARYDQDGQGQEIDARAAGESEEGRQFLREAAERGQVGRSFEAWKSKAGQRESRLGRFTEVTDRSEKAAATQTELEALGIPAFVHAGDLEMLTRLGRIERGGDAAVVNHSQVGISNNIDLPPRETAGHEAFHFWSNTSECTQYQDIIRAGVKWTSSEFVKLYNHINENYFDGKLNLSHEDELEHFFEEFYAYISGYIHNGEDLSGLLSNFQEVKAAWEALVEKESGQKEETKFSLKEDGQDGRERTQQGTAGDIRRFDTGRTSETGATEKGNGRRGSVPADGGFGEVSPSFGQPPVHKWAIGGIITPLTESVAYTEQQVAMDFSVPSYVVSDKVWEENRPRKNGGEATPACSAMGQIYMRETLPESYRGSFAIHEIVHVMAQIKYQPYLDFIKRTPDVLNLRHINTQVLLEGCADHCGVDLFDMKPGDDVVLFDELNATMVGSLAINDPALKYMQDAFSNFGAYTSELMDIVQKFKKRGQGKEGPKFSIKTPDGRELSIEGAEYAGAYTQAERAEAERLWKQLGTESPYFKRFYDGNTPELYEGDGSPRVVYHGTADQITQFEKDVRGSFTNARDAKMGFFFSSSQRVAQGYAKNTFPYEILKLMKEFDRLEALLGTNEEVDSLYKRARDIYEEALLRYKKSGAAGMIIRAFLSMKNPLVVDYHSATYREDIGRYADFIQQAAAEGRDGVVFKNTYDGFYSSNDELSDIFVVFEPGQIKSAEENMGTFDKEDPDIRHSLKGAAELEREIERLIQEGKRTGRSTEEIAGEIQAAALEAYRGQVKEYGAIKPGEKPVRRVQVPKKTADDRRVSQTVRTVLEAGATPDEVVPNIQELTARGEFSHEVFTDQKAMAQAEGTIRSKGYATALSDWTERISKGEVSKKNTALGWALYNQAANAGDLKTAMTVLTKMIGHQRNAAQAVQATRILKQMGPEGQLYGVQRSVENLREELEGRYGNKAPDLQINESLARELLEAGDEKAREEALKNLYRDIGRQMPSRFTDKWNAWRYLAMLGNPRTHVRNVLGNAGFLPVVAAKDLTATAIEGLVYRVSGGKLERTKGAVGPGDRALLAAAWGDYSSIQDQALGGGKYSDFANANRYIEEGRVIFQNRALEGLRKGNSKLLDAGDVFFSKPHYAYALAQYCKANHITVEQMKAGKGLDKARTYAVKEAQKATYRDTNAFSQMVSELGRYQGKNAAKKGLSLALEGILPFRKTPANILARGVEYSPAGLLNGLTLDLLRIEGVDNKAGKWAKSRFGEITAAEAIDHISAGLTGTGLLALGIYLAAQGLVRGSGGDDEDKKKFEELQGHQAYAIELPDGTSVTLDWLAPECLPFFVGVNLWEQTQGEGEAVTMAELLTATANVTEPLLEMSCLQSLNDLFDAVGYASSDGLDGLPSALASATTSYLTQAFPTLLGQAERTGQKERMTTYTEKNAFLTSDTQYTLGRISGRLPGWDYRQIPYIDAWGRTETEESVVSRAAGNFLNPAYTSKVKASLMEEELLRLYEATGESGVLPQRAEKYFTVDGERKDLSAEEYVEYATARGQKAYQILTQLVSGKAYQGMSDAEKAEAVGKVYEYSNAAAKASMSEYKPEGWVAKAMETARTVGVQPAQYVPLYLAKGNIESLKDKAGETIPNSRSMLIMEMVYNVPGLTDKQRRALFEDFGVGSSVRHYNKALVWEKLREMERKVG